MDLNKICDQVIKYCFYLLFFLVPLIMTPWNYELFEYNKMMLVYALTVVIVGAWIAKMILHKKILLCRTPLDIPLVIFFLSQLFSTIFSIDKHTSIFGYYSRFHGGLLSTISYLLLFYGFVSNFDKSKTLTAIRCTLTSAVLVTLYGIAEHYGIDAKYWVQDVRNRVFSTLGQPNWLAAWIAALLPLPLAFLVKYKKNKYLLATFISIFSVFLLCLIFTKSRSGLTGGFISICFFLFILAIQKITKLKKQFLIPLLLLFIVVLSGAGFFGLKFLFKNTQQDLAYIFDMSNDVHIPIHYVQDAGSESGDIRKVVWRGAVKIFKAYPVFGSGVETFAYSYYPFRPVEHNLLSEWDFLYNKAHNEYFNFLATTGAFGLGSYLLLIGWVIAWNIREFKVQNSKLKITIQNSKLSKNETETLKKENFKLLILHFALFSGWASILVTNFFGFSVVPVALFFFLFPAFIFVITQDVIRDTENEKTKQSNNLTIYQFFIIFCVALSSAYFIFLISRYWYADVLYARGSRMEKQGLYNEAFTTLQEATKLNSSEPNYHDELAFISSQMTVLAYSQKQNDIVNQLANQAIYQSDLAMKQSPKNLNYYRTRAKIYYNLARIDPIYLNDAEKILITASQMAPTDAKIIYNLGLVYYQKGDKQKSLETLQKAFKLRPPYHEVRQAIELIEKELGK